MLLKSLFVATTAVTPVLSHTLHSVLVFTRHGDRTAKYFKGYQMTNLGAQEVYSSGEYYRSQYLTNDTHSINGISADRAVPSQLWASAPDQSVLFQTATNFLQGLYPPLGEVNDTSSTEELTNGTAVRDPLNGYQFILVHGEGETDPDTIWLKGDDGCPVYDAAAEAYESSTEYMSTLDRTQSFYDEFESLLAPIMGESDVSYAEAYDVFDLLNVASIHNASIAANISSSDLDQLRYLANEWEWNHNYNASNPDRSIGGMTLAGGILRQLDKIVQGKAALKFNLMAGSYDTFLSFFGLTNLTAASENFYGLPNYAASMAFELFTDDDQHDAAFPVNPAADLKVRFLFRNGTDDSEELTAYPLFGRSADATDLTYGEFVELLGGRAIRSVSQWCTTCESKKDFCVAATQSKTAYGRKNSSGGSGLSNAAAGGIGAGVTLGVVGLIGALAFVLLRRKNRRANLGKSGTAASGTMEKKVAASDSDSV